MAQATQEMLAWLTDVQEGALLANTTQLTCCPWHRWSIHVQIHRPDNLGGTSAHKGSGRQVRSGFACIDCTSSSEKSWHCVCVCVGGGGGGGGGGKGWR